MKKLGFDFQYIVDVGVGYGTPDIYRAFPKAKYLLIEPLIEFREVLDGLCRELNAVYHIAVAGSHDGTTNINVHSDLTGSSVLPQAEGKVMDGTGREVKCVRLENLGGYSGITGRRLCRDGGETTSRRQGRDSVP